MGAVTEELVILNEMTLKRTDSGLIDTCRNDVYHTSKWVILLFTSGLVFPFLLLFVYTRYIDSNNSTERLLSRLSIWILSAEMLIVLYIVLMYAAFMLFLSNEGNDHTE